MPVANQMGINGHMSDKLEDWWIGELHMTSRHMTSRHRRRRGGQTAHSAPPLSMLSVKKVEGHCPPPGAGNSAPIAVAPPARTTVPSHTHTLH